MVKAGAGRLIFVSIAALLTLGGLVSIFTSFTGKAFVLELLGFLFLLVLALLGFLGYGQRWGKMSFFFLFLLYIINLLFLWFYRGNIYLVLLIVSTLGLILALPISLAKRTPMTASTRKHAPLSLRDRDSGEIPSMVFDEPEKTERTEHKGITAKRESFSKSAAGRSSAVPPSSPMSTTPKKTYSPGKYVASSSSNRYHLPKCDWAKKIRPARRVWFQTVEEAQQQGYRAHSCI